MSNDQVSRAAAWRIVAEGVSPRSRVPQAKPRKRRQRVEVMSEQETNGDIAATRLLPQIDADRGLMPSATILAPLRALMSLSRLHGC